MTRPADIPEDVWTLVLDLPLYPVADGDRAYLATDDLAVIARAILADRAGRHSAAGLTAKQHELLSMIADYQARHGQTPSFAEMRDAMGLVSSSGIHRLIQGLEERGRIKRLPNRSRAITIIANPAN